MSKKKDEMDDFDWIVIKVICLVFMVVLLLFSHRTEQRVHDLETRVNKLESDNSERLWREAFGTPWLWRSILSARIDRLEREVKEIKT